MLSFPVYLIRGNSSVLWLSDKHGATHQLTLLCLPGFCLFTTLELVLDNKRLCIDQSVLSDPCRVGAGAEGNSRPHWGFSKDSI